MDGGGGRCGEYEVVISAVPQLGDFLLPAVMQVAGAIEGVSYRYRSSVTVNPVGVASLTGGGPPRTMLGLRAGNEPVDAGMAVRRLGLLSIGLYASEAYVLRHGIAQDGDGLAGHRLVHHDQERDHAPWDRWLGTNGPGARIVIRSNDELVRQAAVRSGQCAAFLPLSSLLWNPHLREVMPPRPDWAAPLWMVTPPIDAMPEVVARATTMLGDLLRRCLGG